MGSSHENGEKQDPQTIVEGMTTPQNRERAVQAYRQESAMDGQVQKAPETRARRHFRTQASPALSGE